MPEKMTSEEATKCHEANGKLRFWDLITAAQYYELTDKIADRLNDDQNLWATE